jgi:hypothetical protein
MQESCRSQIAEQAMGRIARSTLACCTEIAEALAQTHKQEACYILAEEASVAVACSDSASVGVAHWCRLGSAWLAGSAEPPLGPDSPSSALAMSTNPVVQQDRGEA